MQKHQDHPHASDWAERLNLKKIGPNAYSGPCPLCGGDDRFHVTERNKPLVGCRGCIDNEKPPIRAKRYGDLIETVFPELSRRNKNRPLAIKRPVKKKYRTPPHAPNKEKDSPKSKSVLPLLLWDLSTHLFPGPGTVYLSERKLHPRHEPVTSFRDIRWIQKSNCPRNHPGWPGLPDGSAGAIIVAYRQYEHLKAVLLEALTDEGKTTKKRWRRVFGKPNGSCLQAIKAKNNPIVITEGYTSALAAHWLYPDHNAISIGSTSNTAHITRDFTSHFNTHHAIIDTDGDEPGQQAGWHIYKNLKEQNINAALLLRAQGDAADELALLMNHNIDD